MIYKDGVVRHGLHWRMRLVEQIADVVWDGFGQKCVMTSGLDGKHSQWSWHYYGCAVDLRTSYFNDEVAKEVADKLRRALATADVRYQIVLHPHEYNGIEMVAPGHIHVEFDHSV